MANIDFQPMDAQTGSKIDFQPEVSGNQPEVSGNIQKQEPGLLSRMGEDIGESFQKANDVSNRPWYQHWYQMPAASLVRLGEVAGGVNQALLGEPLKSTYETLVPESARKSIHGHLENFLNQKDVHKGLATIGDFVNSLYESDPEKADILKALFNLQVLSPISAEAKASAADTLEASGIRGAMRDKANRIYESAAKWPTGLTPETREAITKTLLKEKIPLTRGGYDNLMGTVSDINSQIDSAIKAEANKPIDAVAVVKRMQPAITKALDSYDPASNISDIKAEFDKFMKNWGNGKLTMGKAQTIKKDIYRQLERNYEAAEKDPFGAYSEAKIAAMKQIARGLKEEIESNSSNKFLKELNAKESELLTAEPYLRRAINRIGNRNILSLDDVLAATGGAVVAGPQGAATAGVIKKILGSPGIKSRIAIQLAKEGKYPQSTIGKLLQSLLKRQEPSVPSNALQQIINKGGK